MTSKKKNSIFHGLKFNMVLSYLALSCNVSAKACQQIGEGENLFTVLNWNTLYCFNHGEAVDRGVEWIKNQHTNVVALQELNGQTHLGFKKLAERWDHGHAVLLREEGFPSGLTSKEPIEVIERRVDGFHHGFLHCKTYGIHFFVIHLWPGKDHELVKSLEHRIDFILASQNLEEKSRSVTILRSPELDRISDHYPVIAKFKYKD